jgi:DNA helicase-2/ATP-dependent DNA helicase PcrA
VRALREYKDGEILYVSHVGPFVDMHVAYSIPLINTTPFAQNEESITLLTSHGAKGLEFAHVFIIGAHDKVWASLGKGNKLRFPVTLPLSQTPDDEDDFIRLFYVALTRARHSIMVTYHESPFRFLEHEAFASYKHDAPHSKKQELLALGLKVHHHAPFARNEKSLLKRVLDGYQLSPTHLNNFLNIIDGGPMKFLEQNLLRFPQSKHMSSVYGTAIHTALEDMYRFYKKNGNAPTYDHVLKVFVKELRRGRLLDYEEEKAKKRGEGVLARYYKEEVDRLGHISHVELDFKRQGVVLDGAHVTGKIDRVVEKEKGVWHVMDIKTGKALSSWERGGTVHDDIKIHNYRYQLMMYKLLVEHSRDYRNHEVKEATLEFVEEEDDNGDTRALTLLFSDITHAELKRFRDLVSIVYTKIKDVDFPDTSRYEKTIKGIEQFEEDLLAGKV